MTPLIGRGFRINYLLYERRRCRRFSSSITPIDRLLPVHLIATPRLALPSSQMDVCTRIERYWIERDHKSNIEITTDIRTAIKTDPATSTSTRPSMDSPRSATDDRPSLRLLPSAVTRKTSPIAVSVQASGSHDGIGFQRRTKASVPYIRPLDVVSACRI